MFVDFIISDGKEDFTAPVISMVVDILNVVFYEYGAVMIIERHPLLGTSLICDRALAGLRGKVAILVKVYWFKGFKYKALSVWKSEHVRESDGLRISDLLMTISNVGHDPYQEIRAFISLHECNKDDLSRIKCEAYRAFMYYVNVGGLRSAVHIAADQVTIDYYKIIKRIEPPERIYNSELNLHVIPGNININTLDKLIRHVEHYK
jgi:hypothetical protein